jgi:hypothetical protein
VFQPCFSTFFSFLTSIPPAFSPFSRFPHSSMANIPQEIDQLISKTESFNWLENSSQLISTILQGDQQPPAILAGRVTSLRTISKSTVKGNIQNAWQFLSSLSFEEIGPNTYLFTFENQDELKRVMELSPWNIRGHPLVLKH